MKSKIDYNKAGAYLWVVIIILLITLGFFVIANLWYKPLDELDSDNTSGVENTQKDNDDKNSVENKENAEKDVLIETKEGNNNTDWEDRIRVEDESDSIDEDLTWSGAEELEDDESTSEDEEDSTEENENWINSNANDFIIEEDLEDENNLEEDEYVEEDENKTELDKLGNFFQGKTGLPNDRWNWENLIKNYFTFWNLWEYKRACDLLRSDKCNSIDGRNLGLFTRFWKKLEWGYDVLDIYKPESQPYGVEETVYCVKYEYKLKNDLSPDKIREIFQYRVAKKENWEEEITLRICESKTKWTRTLSCDKKNDSPVCLDNLK